MEPSHRCSYCLSDDNSCSHCSLQAVAMDRCRWCCKAALIPHSPLRLRIMRALRMMLNPSEFAYQAKTPESIQTVAIGMFSLLPTIYGSGEEHTILNEG